MQTQMLFTRSGAASLLLITLLCQPLAAETTSDIQMTQQHFQSLLKTKPGFYPVCQQVPVQVGKENFQKKHLALSGLQGIHLDVDGLLKSAGGKNIKMVDQLKQKVVQRLAKGGLKLLSKKEMERTPGQPEMSMFMSFPAHLTPVKKGKKPVAYRPDCCTMGIWTSFSQAATLLRDPDTNYKLGTWGEGHNTNDCSDPAGWMSSVILKTLDSFVAEKRKGDNDYAKLLKKRPKQPKKLKQTTSEIQRLRQEIASELAALQKPAKPPPPVQPARPIKAVLPKPATPTPAPITKPVKPLPQHCNGAVQTYIDMFATNQVHIDSSNHYALDALAANMKACPMYSYIIETHADPRSSFAYNEKLSALRAASIQGYLLAQGVAKQRFIIQSFGELNPISQGTTALDYAANRRVVVRPYLRKVAK